MNKNILTILTAATLILTTGCATAGTWVNGYYIDGPLCTVCDGLRVITHAYGTTTCTHCDGTGIEPPEETVIVENVVVGGWCPPPPRWHHPRPIVRRPPPRHLGGVRHHGARPAVRRPAPRPAGRGHTGSGGGRRR